MISAAAVGSDWLSHCHATGEFSETAGFSSGLLPVRSSSDVRPGCRISAANDVRAERILIRGGTLEDAEDGVGIGVNRLWIGHHGAAHRDEQSDSSVDLVFRALLIRHGVVARRGFPGEHIAQTPGEHRMPIMMEATVVYRRLQFLHRRGEDRR